jgi:hypothetical protein
MIVTSRDTCSYPWALKGYVLYHKMRLFHCTLKDSPVYAEDFSELSRHESINHRFQQDNVSISSYAVTWNVETRMFCAPGVVHSGSMEPTVRETVNRSFQNLSRTWFKITINGISNFRTPLSNFRTSRAVAIRHILINTKRGGTPPLFLIWGGGGGYDVIYRLQTVSSRMWPLHPPQTWLVLGEQSHITTHTSRTETVWWEWGRFFFLTFRGGRTK